MELSPIATPPYDKLDLGARHTNVKSPPKVVCDRNSNLDNSTAQNIQTEAQNNQHNSSRGSLNIHDLSFILHPCHDASTSENDSPNIHSQKPKERENSTVIAHACHALRVTPNVLEKMINIYFDNMTAINLFLEPNFREKLQNIDSPTQLHALLASILAFSARFCAQEGDDEQDHNSIEVVGICRNPTYFLNLASQFTDEALRQCDDEAPPLCLLQALILLSHGQLTQGVRGKAWRSLGVCVRLAYELNLHLIDFGYPIESIEVDVKQWSEQEEKRRAWWAIWEMDVFASTIRRCPTAIGWSQIETLLPVEDEYWFQGEYRQSCFLEKDFARRWKALQESGNQSPKAWFIVINSLMKEAQCISSPRGVTNFFFPDERRQSAKSNKYKKQTAVAADEARDKLEILSNSVRCFVLALPTSLRYRHQYLGFDVRKPGQTASLRQLHCGLYNIHVMTQLAKLMIYRYEVFSGTTRAGFSTSQTNSRGANMANTGNDGTNITSTMNGAQSLAISQYFEAADEILTIVHRCCDDHIQWINAFLASTIWLASAVQLVRKEFGPSGTNRALVKSKFEVLYMTYKKCVLFWNIQTALQQNLESLESHLERFRANGTKRHEQLLKNNYRRDITRAEPWTGEIDMIHSNMNKVQDSDIGATNGPPSSSSQRPQVGPLYLEPISPAASNLDFMHVSSQTDSWSHGKGDLQIPPSNLIDQALFSESGEQSQAMCADSFPGLTFGLNMDSSDIELQSYIDELLSGGYTY
ncbi:hypothetical protein B7463_g11187, partial [Scytalidium lignicola]